MDEYITIGLSVIFGITTIFFSIQNHHLKKRLLAVEELRDKERKMTASKAQLRAKIDRSNKMSEKLLIENIGNSEARNINIIMDGKPFDEHKAAVSGDGQINYIGAHSQATRLLAMTFACAPPFELEISWEDDSGEPGRYKTTLTF